MTTTESKSGLGGYEAASERRSEPKEPLMTKTQDELLAALTGAIEWDKARGYRMPYRVRDPLYAAIDALRSPDPEVERLRAELDARADEGMMVLETLSKMTPQRAHRHVIEGLALARKARAALPTPEGG